MAGKKVAAEQVTFGQKPVKSLETGRWPQIATLFVNALLVFRPANCAGRINHNGDSPAMSRSTRNGAH
jgi:hypothetical protein